MGMGGCHEASPRAFVELGENLIGQTLKGPANAVLTGQRQCQPRGKQRAENQRGGHGERISMGKDGGDRWNKAAAKESHVSRGQLTARACARNMPCFGLVFRLRRLCHSRQFTRPGRPLVGCQLGTCGIISPRFWGMRGRIRRLLALCRIRPGHLIVGSSFEESS
jgi:hypothetical protein